jgi:HPt (histidine-containing phosphotransfer) domain-containing protein
VTVQNPAMALFESIGCDEEAYAELLDCFLEDAPPRVTAIRGAVASGDLSTLAREAHTYKGAAAVLEAIDVVGRAERLEQLARAGRLDGAVEIADGLAADSALLFDAIRRYRSAFLRAA